MNEIISIQLPGDARSPWIENGNRLCYHLVATMSADFGSERLPDGNWTIVSVKTGKNVEVVLEKKNF